ncbi:MAG: Mut7-C RNAse domain-containing protein [Candidatus Nitrosotenuis sp.]
MNQDKLVVDSMLGTVAKKLRMLGFDCSYSANIEDEDLLLVAKRESRIIITKDTQLANKAKKHDIHSLQVVSPTEKEQLVEIAKKLNIKKYHFGASDARCPSCNGILCSIQKSLIVKRVPPKIIQNVDEFWICQGCSHIYWEGTHIRNLERLIAEINEQL